MTISQILPKLDSPTLEYQLERTLAAVAHQVQQCHSLQRRMIVRFSFDDCLDQAEIEQICSTLHHMRIWAEALQRVAAQLENEVDDTEDRYYTWLVD